MSELAHKQALYTISQLEIRKKRKIEGSEDYALDIEKLGLDKDYPESINKNLRCLIEKGTVNKIYGLELRSN